MARKNNLLKQYKKQKIEMTDEEKAAHAAAVDQVIAHFAETYVPSGDTRLANLQQLCRDLEVEVGTSSMTCKMNIKGSHVNIHDFIRVSVEKGNVSSIKFPSHKALQDDIRSNPARRFPLREAEQDELLEAMLIFTTGENYDDVWRGKE